MPQMVWYLCVHVVRMHVHMCVWVFSPVHAPVEAQDQLLVFLSIILHLIVLGLGLSLNLELAISDRLADSKHLSLPPQEWRDYRCAPPYPAGDPNLGLHSSLPVELTPSTPK